MEQLFFEILFFLFCMLEFSYVPGNVQGTRYPAATLSMYGLQSRTYKKPEAVQARIGILNALEELGMSISQRAYSNATESADALDAIVCVLAGMDFLKGDAHPPENPGLAAKGRMDMGEKKAWGCKALKLTIWGHYSAM
ncbi:MAG: DUF429 domain-containing protein [Desulfuromonadales bacterium]|nr:DUF429 domain-containing protein [Desulfuromonadales bacterium]